MWKLLVLLILLILTISAVFASRYLGEQLAMTSAVQVPNQVVNPCVFKQAPQTIDESPELGNAHRAWSTRQSLGYGRDTSIEEALRIFNSELKCYPFWATLPPLTEQEVIANVIGGPDYGDEKTWSDQEKILSSIAAKKIMPKGSLFVAESGGCKYEPRPTSQTCVKGLKIYLFLGLDKAPRESGVSPERIILIRKTYFDIQLSND